ncbi:MAG: hypothetical protein Q9174_004359 [Haloplaca sp. 1 TL-2023]
MADQEMTKLVLSLSTKAELTYDLWTGFTSKVVINLRYTGALQSNGLPPLLEYSAPGIVNGKITAVWALTMGLLVIKDAGGRVIPINAKPLVDLIPRGNRTVNFLRAPEGDDLELGQLPRKLLKQLRSRLSCGHVCTLGFNDWSFRILAVPMTLDNKRLRMYGDVREVDGLCHGESMTFKVVPGIPLPRFAVSLTTSQPCTDSPEEFELSIRLTLLDNLPTELKLSDRTFTADDYFGLGKWIKICLFGERDLHCPWATCAIRPDSPKWHTADGSVLEPRPETLIFHRTTSYIFRCKIGTHIFRSMEKQNDDRRRFLIKLMPDECNLTSWTPYLERNEKVQEIGQDSEGEKEKFDHGPIELIPCVEGWDVIEEELEEQRKPMLLFRLPPELRQMIYNYVKFSEGAEEVGLEYPRRPPTSKCVSSR